MINKRVKASKKNYEQNISVEFETVKTEAQVEKLFMNMYGIYDSFELAKFLIDRTRLLIKEGKISAS